MTSTIIGESNGSFFHPAHMKVDAEVSSWKKKGEILISTCQDNRLFHSKMYTPKN